MKNYVRFYSILLFLIVASGCSRQPPFKSIDDIIASPDRCPHLLASIVEQPESSGPFHAGISATSSVGKEINGAYSHKKGGLTYTINVRHPAVEGQFYIATPLTDKDGKVSLLVTLHYGTSDDDSSEPPNLSETP
ncbi:MAG: hypothetical protein FWD31_10840 [Planctomycetaceae bacterium]|nr:hypothetical protein [Planctomycetaceae bacterium]